jgi:hypothetical protein
MAVMRLNIWTSMCSGVKAPADIESNAPVQFADAAHEMTAKPPIRQISPVGNGAHSVPSEPSSFAECAPEFTGMALLNLDQIVNRVLAANKLFAQTTPCPQGADCAGDGKHSRIFDCEDGCGFRGCSACMEGHEAESHWSDSASAREMWGTRSP